LKRGIRGGQNRRQFRSGTRTRKTVFGVVGQETGPQLNFIKPNGGGGTNFTKTRRGPGFMLLSKAQRRDKGEKGGAAGGVLETSGASYSPVCPGSRWGRETRKFVKVRSIGRDEGSF